MIFGRMRDQALVFSCCMAATKKFFQVHDSLCACAAQQVPDKKYMA